MNSTNYAKGRRFEYRAKRSLESQGFVVFRSAGSHSRADLIALRAGEVWLVQCKANDGYLSTQEREGLVLVALELGVVPILAHKEGRRLIFRRADNAL